jgi:AraC family transcriptional regulator
MRQSHEPVTLGSQHSTAVDTGLFSVTDAWFPAGSVLEPHTHDRSIVAVMLDGSFDTAIASRRIECVPMTMWSEPLAERHANYIGMRGARVVVVQPDPRRHEHLAPFKSWLDEVRHARDPLFAVEARRLTAEVATGDSLSPLAMDALVMLMMTRAARLVLGKRVDQRPPPWLLRARDQVHAHFRERLDLAGIADEAHVTPWRLAREFRRHFHASVGEYARALRLEWALRELAIGDLPISAIAQSAGYADQSHLTRVCTAATGLAPAAYRRRERTEEDRATPRSVLRSGDYGST